MRQGKQRISFVMIMILAVQMLLCVGVANAVKASAKKDAAKQEPFEISTSYGIDGYVTYDAAFEAKVTLKSDQDFKGTLKLIPVRTADYDPVVVTGYGTEISLAAGSEKTYSVMLPSTDGLNGVRIQILDSKGKVVQKKKETIKLKSTPSTAMIGILSDDYASISYLDQYSTGVVYDGKTIATSVMELTKDSFPETEESLEMLHYIVIDNFDTSNLSDAQYAALKDWVNQGGVLLVGLGANYQNVLHIFNDDFLSGNFGAIEKKDINIAFVPETKDDSSENASSEDAPTLKAEGVDTLSVVCDGAKELDVLGNSDLVYIKPSGRGNIVLAAFDFGMEPFISSDVKKPFMEQVLQAAISDQIKNRLTYNTNRLNIYENGSQLSEYADTSKKPSAGLFGLILFIYVLFVGPGIYLVLKKLNKREKIWVAIPVISVAFTGVIFLTSLMYIVKKPVVNVSSFLELKDDGMTEISYIDIICPGAKDYDIDFNEGYNKINANEDYMYNTNMILGLNAQNDENEERQFICDVEGHKRLTLRNQSTFTTSRYITTKSAPNTVGTVDLDLECTTKGFSGTVTNNTDYDIKGAVVTYESFVCMLGDIKAGESVSIKKSKVQFYNSYGFFDTMMDTTGTMSFMNDPEKRMENLINCSFENMIMNTDYNNGLFWGRVAGYKNDVVSDKSAKESNMGIIIQKYTQNYSDLGEDNYVFLGSNNSTISNGDFDMNSRVLYSGTADVVYSTNEFNRLTSIEKIADTETHMEWGPIDAIYFYNHASNSYDKVFDGTDKIEGNAVENYIRDGSLTVRYETSNGGGYVPKIMLRGDKHADN